MFNTLKCRDEKNVIGILNRLYGITVFTVSVLIILVFYILRYQLEII